MKTELGYLALSRVMASSGACGSGDLGMGATAVRCGRSDVACLDLKPLDKRIYTHTPLQPPVLASQHEPKPLPLPSLGSVPTN